MEQQHYFRLSEIQSTHWFYRYRRQLLEKAIRKHFKIQTGQLRILDFGAGMGANLPVLTQWGKVTCVEREPEAVSYLKAQWPVCEVLSEIQRSLGGEGGFDLIVISYVLYHREISDPCSVLKTLSGLTRSGGILINLEPAFDGLRGRLDLVAHGIRRFSSSSLSLIHKEGGWSPFQSLYILPSLFPLVWLGRRIEKVLRKNGMVQAHKKGTLEHGSGKHVLINFLFSFWISTVDRFFPSCMPFGIGVFMSSKKIEIR